MWHSVRFRLTLWYTAVLLALLTLFSLAIYLLAQAQLYASLDQGLGIRMQQVSGSLDYQSGDGSSTQHA